MWHAFSLWLNGYWIGGFVDDDLLIGDIDCDRLWICNALGSQYIDIVADIGESLLEIRKINLSWEHFDLDSSVVVSLTSIFFANFEIHTRECMELISKYVF